MIRHDDYRQKRSAEDGYKKGWVPASEIKGIPLELIKEYVFTVEICFCSDGRPVLFYDPRRVRKNFGLLTKDDIKSLKKEGYADDDLEPYDKAVEALENYKKNKEIAS